MYELICQRRVRRTINDVEHKVLVDDAKSKDVKEQGLRLIN